MALKIDKKEVIPKLFAAWTGLDHTEINSPLTERFKRSLQGASLIFKGNNETRLVTTFA